MMNEWILSSTLLIAAVVLVRFVLRENISLRLRYALWLVVLVRLLVPVQLFTSDFGVGQVARDVDLSTPVRRVYTAAHSDDYAAEYEAVYQQLQAEYAAMDQPVSSDSLDKEASSRVAENRSLDLTRTLYSLWLSGIAVLTLVFVGCNGRFALRLRRSRKPVEENVLLPVYESSLVPTPCMFGVFSPAIYLTSEVAVDEKARTHVLAHELTHYSHWDHIWSVLRCVCLVLHWYNPLVWLAFRLSREDAELACDEGALEQLGEQTRTEYGRTLIQLTCGEKLSTGLIAATTMTGSARSIARRLKTLLQRRRTTLLALTAVIVAGVLAVGCGFAGAPEITDPTKTAESTDTTVPTETTEPTGHAPEQDMSYQGQDLPIADHPGQDADPVEQIRALFAGDAKPDCRVALIRLYDVPDEPIEYSEEELFLPEIQDIVMADSSHADMYYHRPGDHRLYVARVYAHEGTWRVSSNRLVISMDDYMYMDRSPRALTEQELDRFRAAFATLNADGEINPAACFLLNYYEDVTQMRRRDFMAYFPGSTEGTEGEFELLKEKYPDFFEGWTWENMPIPIHSYDPEDLSDVLRSYAGIRWEDLADDGTHYLEQTGRFYNYTSDFGLGGFYARSGFVYEGGAVIVGDRAALILHEHGGEYYVQAYVPAVMPRES